MMHHRVHITAAGEERNKSGQGGGGGGGVSEGVGEDIASSEWLLPLLLGGPLGHEPGYQLATKDATTEPSSRD